MPIKVTSWWRYNPIMQKPVALNPVQPWGWFYYWGPDPAAGISYGQYHSDEGEIITEKKDTVYSPLSGKKLEFITDVESSRVEEMFHKAEADNVINKYTCQSCNTRAVVIGSITGIEPHCVYCGNVIGSDKMNIKDSVKSKLEKTPIKAEEAFYLVEETPEEKTTVEIIDQPIDIDVSKENVDVDQILDVVEEEEQKERGLVKDIDAYEEMLSVDNILEVVNSNEECEERDESCVAEGETAMADNMSVSIDEIMEAMNGEAEGCDLATSEEEDEESEATAEGEEDLEMDIDIEEPAGELPEAPALDMDLDVDMSEESNKLIPDEIPEEEPEYVSLEEIRELIEQKEEEGEEMISLDEIAHLVEIEEDDGEGELPEAPEGELPEAPEGELPEAPEGELPEAPEENEVPEGGEEDEFLPLNVILSEVNKVAARREKVRGIKQRAKAKKEEVGNDPTEDFGKDLKADDLELGDNPPADKEIKYKEQEKVGEEMRFEPVATLESLASAKRDDIDMILLNEGGDNPVWNVTVAGVPAARIQLSNQESPDEIRRVFCSADYAHELIEHCDRSGFIPTMKKVKAEFWSTTDTNEDRQLRVRAQAVAELAEDKKQYLNRFKTDFLRCLGIAVAGINKNYYPDVGNPIKDNLFSNMKIVGLPESTAVSVIEKSFKEASASYFRSVMDKATEYMALSDEAKREIAAAISDANTIEPYVEGRLEEAEPATLADRVAQASVLPNLVNQGGGLKVEANNLTMDSESFKRQLKGSWRR